MCYWCEIRKSCLSCGKPLQEEKPTSSCMVDSVVRLKQSVSAVLHEALSGMDAWGDKTRFRDDNGFVRWGIVEKEIYKFIDEANA